VYLPAMKRGARRVYFWLSTCANAWTWHIPCLAPWVNRDWSRVMCLGWRLGVSKSGKWRVNPPESLNSTSLRQLPALGCGMYIYILLSHESKNGETLLWWHPCLTKLGVDHRSILSLYEKHHQSQAKQCKKLNGLALRQYCWYYRSPFNANL